MIAIKHAEIVDGEARVIWLHCLPEMLTAEDLEGSIEFDELPKIPAIVGGKTPELFINTTTNTLFYKYMDTQEDSYAMSKQIKEIQIAINTLLGI